MGEFAKFLYIFDQSGPQPDLQPINQIVASVRTILEQHPEWAVLSDDKTNGFNCISRRSIMAGLRRWFPDLIPTFSLNTHRVSVQLLAKSKRLLLL